mmetsp:Transcript_13395/g.27351  ORF Transcript_13395/g.27351 Transcript_13395/m.27351 type:complete len:153 (-) Transcript_13395:2684-3142(-)
MLPRGEMPRQILCRGGVLRRGTSGGCRVRVRCVVELPGGWELPVVGSGGGDDDGAGDRDEARRRCDDSGGGHESRPNDDFAAGFGADGGCDDNDCDDDCYDDSHDDDRDVEHHHDDVHDDDFHDLSAIHDDRGLVSECKLQMRRRVLRGKLE